MPRLQQVEVSKYPVNKFNRVVASEIVVGGTPLSDYIASCAKVSAPARQVLVQPAANPAPVPVCPARKLGAGPGSCVLVSVSGGKFAQVAPPSNRALNENPSGLVLCYTRDAGKGGCFVYKSPSELCQRGADSPDCELKKQEIQSLQQSLVDQFSDRFAVLESRLEKQEATPCPGQAGSPDESTAVLVEQVQTLTEELLRLKAQVAALPKPRQRAPRKTKAQREAEEKAAAEAAAAEEE